MLCNIIPTNDDESWEVRFLACTMARIGINAFGPKLATWLRLLQRQLAALPPHGRFLNVQKRAFGEQLGRCEATRRVQETFAANSSKNIQSVDAKTSKLCQRQKCEHCSHLLLAQSWSKAATKKYGDDADCALCVELRDSTECSCEHCMMVIDLFQPLHTSSFEHHGQASHGESDFYGFLFRRG